MINAIDLKLVRILEQNSRLSYAELGRRLDLSPSTIRERIQKLEDRGVIKNYTISVNYSLLGYGLEAFIGLKLHSGKLKTFMQVIHTFPEIIESYRVTGPQNIQMKVILKDQLHLQSFIDQLILYGDPTTSLILSKIKG